MKQKKVQEKPQYDYLADTCGDQDGYTLENEEKHLENMLEKLVNRLKRFKRLPQKLRGMSMNFPERLKKYGIYILADKKLQCINGFNQVFISSEKLVEEMGKKQFTGTVLKYDKHLNLENIWVVDDILLGDVDHWKKVKTKGLEINYYSIMRRRRRLHRLSK